MRSRIVSSVLLVALTVAFALPVYAAEESPEPETTTETSEVVTDYEPAVEVDLDATEDAGEEPWTTRFLVPTALLLAAVTVFGTVVQYFTKVVRARYKVIE